jgi:hypothetical protein
MEGFDSYSTDPVGEFAQHKIIPSQPMKPRQFISYKCEPRKKTVDEARRVICMAYECSEDGTVKYGACVFRKENPTEKCRKKDIRTKAQERLTKWPLKFKVPLGKNETLDVKNAEDMQKVVMRIRKTMFTYGTFNKAKKLWTDSLVK